VYEIYIPSVAFSILFITFIWQIISRYVFNKPISWSNEAQVFGYIWTVLPAACYIRRINKHVCFSVIYDILNPKAQRIMRIIANLVIAITYSILLPYTIEFIAMDKVHTPIFNVPRTFVFSPMIIFVLAAVLYCLFDIYHDVRTIVRGEPPKDPRLDVERKYEESLT
jgi:TRAP-type C4-dicarboxylate transport system permease small subunit